MYSQKYDKPERSSSRPSSRSKPLYNNQYIYDYK
jgi:hypothetical protein